MKNIMLIAPPAAGKGTQSNLIIKKYNIPHISTGDILRDIAKENSEIGNYVSETVSSGGLVKDEIIYKLIEDRLKKKDCQNGFVIDGFPRNIDQAIKYDEILKKLGMDIGIVLQIDVPKDVISSRITGRRICEDCNHIYNINIDAEKPKVESVCDVCGGKLYQRNDDNIEAFNHRFEVYEETSTPIVEHYKKQGVLNVINGNDSVDNIFKNIDSIISKEGKR